MYNFEDIEQTEENQKDIEKIKNLIESGNCAVRVCLDFDYKKTEEHTDIIDGKSIKTVKLTTGSGTNSGISIGAVISNSLTATLDLPYPYSLEGRKFQLKLKYEYLGSDKITYGELTKFTYAELAKMTVQEITDLKKIKNSVLMGTFRIYEAKATKIYKTGNANRAEYSIKACDALGECDVEYIPQGEYESSVDVENAICEYLGIESKRVSHYIYRTCDNYKIYKPKNALGYSFQGFVFRFPKPPTGKTMRQLLSYIASLQGKFAVINRMGELEYRWYEKSGFEISPDTMSAIETAESDIFYSGIECKVDDKITLKSPNSEYFGKNKIMSFENPYMTQTKLDEIRKTILWRRFIEPKLKFRCTKINQILAEPRLDNWDIVTAKNELSEEIILPIIRIDYTFNGGFSAAIESEVK